MEAHYSPRQPIQRNALSLRWLSTAFFAIVLGGCATTPDDLKKTQYMSFESKKTSHLVTACVGDGWERILNLVNSRPISNGYKIEVKWEEYIYLLAEITDTAEGKSATKFWIGQYLLQDSKRQAATKVVSDCQ